MSVREVVAVIPARGGSKGVPRKNLRRVGGIPLVVRAIETAHAARGIDRVVVSTDDAEIAGLARAHGAEVVERPAAIAGDAATSESAIDHALDALAARSVDPSVIVFIQATSPFIDPADIDDAIARVHAGTADVVFSAVPSWGFLWRPDGEDGGATGVNHDPAHRPRRQDREPEYLETGAFYVLDARRLRARTPPLLRHRRRGNRRRVERDRDRHGGAAAARERSRRRHRPRHPAHRRRRGGHRLRRRPHRRPGARSPKTAPSTSRSAAPTAWASPSCVRAGIPVLILSTETQPRGRRAGPQARRRGAARSRRQGIRPRRSGPPTPGSRSRASPTSATTSTTSDASSRWGGPSPSPTRTRSSTPPPAPS